ncbi:MAG: fatty acid desaturase [Proteobacteria bacterium]|nr:MAG: fatty acid desaturase [Pseudomonadota bacterium]
MAASFLSSDAASGALPFDVSRVDLDAFAREIDALRAEEEARLGLADFHHFRRRAYAGRALTALGYATGVLAPNPVSAALLALGSTARFTIVAHHVMHRAMDRIPGVPAHYTSRHFAKGTRRWVDWLDWIHPRAWDIEHNVLHHYATGEVEDPDLVEENVAGLADASRTVRLAVAALYAFTWKITYYAPSTFQIVARGEARRRRGEPTNHRADARGEGSYLDAFDLRSPEGRQFWRECVLPYLGGRFVVPTALAAVLGPWAAFSTLTNSMGAELLANLHTFLIIASNHAGEDLHRFDDKHKGRAELYLRQVLGSVNFTHGGAVRNFLSGYLGHQIEHHLYPDLPPSSLERLAPKVQALCAKYGIPYVQEPVLVRARKLLRIMIGSAKMQRTDTKRPRPSRSSTARRAVPSGELAAEQPA